MHTFRIWAPKAHSAVVNVDGAQYALEREEGGWWSAAVDEARPGSDYTFQLDGDPTDLPDPRSAHQPQGVHGPSRVVDHAAFQWTDSGFQPKAYQGAVIYELHIGTFTPEGTCDSAIAKLQHLVDLGVTHVELLPFAQFPGEHGWGYDGVDLFAPHIGYGGPDGLKRFVDAAHRAGLAVIMDVVYNHFGPAGNYVSRFGPYYTDAHKTPWGDAVNLEDSGSHEVRRFFCDNALMWLRDYHMDGLRLDAVHAFVDRSAIHFMEQINTEVHALQGMTGKRYVMIAESDLNDPRLVRSKDGYGFGFDVQWSDDFHHALVALMTGDTTGYYADFGQFADLAKAISDTFVYDGEFSEFRNRVHGRRVENLPGWAFIVCSQNHDQVGNQAKGERLVHLTDIPRAKIAAAIIILSPYLPMLFQGEEWAASAPFQYFTDHEDPELGRLVSEGRKKEFSGCGWNCEEIPDPQASSTFTDSKLNWEELDKEPHADMLQWYRDLIKLRHSYPELCDGAIRHVDVDFDEDERWLTMQRGSIVVVFTLDEEGYATSVGENVRILMASDKDTRIDDGMLSLPGTGIAILEVD